MKLFTRDGDKSHRPIWGLVSGSLLLVSIGITAVVIWKGLVLDINRLTLSDAAAEMRTQIILQMWAFGLLVTGIACYAVSVSRSHRDQDKEQQNHAHRRFAMIEGSGQTDSDSRQALGATASCDTDQANPQLSVTACEAVSSDDTQWFDRL